MLQIHTYYLIATAATLTGQNTSIFFLSTLISAAQFVFSLSVLQSLLTKMFSVHIIACVHMCVICFMLHRCAPSIMHPHSDIDGLEGITSVGITTSMAQTHAALLAPVWLHDPFKDAAPHIQSCPGTLLISGRASRAVRSAAPSSPPIRFNLLGVQLPECNSTSLSTPTSSDQCCTKPSLPFAWMYFFLRFCCRSSIHPFSNVDAQEEGPRSPLLGGPMHSRSNYRWLSGGQRDPDSTADHLFL